MTPSLLSRLGHRVQRASVLEPLDLGLVESVVQLNFEGLAILGVDPHGNGLANSQLGAQDVDLEVKSVSKHWHILNSNRE